MAPLTEPSISRNARLSIPNPFHRAELVIAEAVGKSEDGAALQIGGARVERGAIERAADKAFAEVKDTHFLELGKSLGLKQGDASNPRDNARFISVADLGLYGNTLVSIDDSGTPVVQLTLLLTTPACGSKAAMKSQLADITQRELQVLPGLENVRVQVSDQYEQLIGAIFSKDIEKRDQFLAKLDPFLPGASQHKKSHAQYAQDVAEVVATIRAILEPQIGIDGLSRLMDFQRVWVPPETRRKFETNYLGRVDDGSDLSPEEQTLMDFLDEATNTSQKVWQTPRIKPLVDACNSVSDRQERAKKKDALQRAVFALERSMHSAAHMTA